MSVAKGDGRTLAQLYEGLRAKLLTDAKAFARLAEHSGEMGTHNETTLRNVIRSQLPSKFEIGTGFVESGSGSRSRQQDIVIYDGFNNTPLYQSDDWSIFPVEIVLAAIEVKTTLDASALRSALESCRILRELATEQALLLRYDDHGGGVVGWTPWQRSGMPKPRYFVFAYQTTWQSFDAFQRAVVDQSKQVPDAHLHGVCVLEKDWWAARQPHDGGQHKYSTLAEGGWRQFLVNVHLTSEPLYPTIIVDKFHYLRTTNTTDV